MNPSNRLLGSSALQAFREDLASVAEHPTADDQAAVLTATLLRQSLAAEDSTAGRVRDEAIKIARASLGEHVLSQGMAYDDHPAQSMVDVIRLLAHRSDLAGRLRLALHLLESVSEMAADPIESGRIRSDRARVARKLGYLDLSYEQNRQLLRDARARRSTELAARAHFGLSAIAQTRGNLVEQRSRIQRMVRFARAGRHVSLFASGLSALGTIASKEARYGDAVAHFWKACRISGHKPAIFRAAMGNLAQTLLISGRPAEARKVAAMVLTEATALIHVLPTLGVFVVSSAQLGDPDAVRWAASHIRRYAQSKNHRREAAEALVECAAALNAIGEAAEAAMMNRQGIAIATRFGFHDLTFQEGMPSIQRVAQPSPFHPAAAKAAAAIDEMDVPRLPELVAGLSE